MWTGEGMFCVCLGELVKNKKSDLYESSDTFFLEADCGKFVPRSLFIDLEPSVIG